MRPHRFAWVLALATVGCGSRPAAPPPPDDTPLEQLDPDALAWVSPLAGDTIATGDPLVLAVATDNDDATVVHFGLDGAEVGACDPYGALATAPGDDDGAADCHDGRDWQWTVTAPAAGTHRLSAWIVRADGSRLEADRDVTIVASITGVLSPGDPTEPDPVPDGALSEDPGDLTLADGAPGGSPGASPDPGFVDPSHDWTQSGGDTSWKVQGQRILTRDSQGHAHVEQGSVHAIEQCMDRFGDSVRRYADLGYVSRATAIGLAVAGAGCRDGAAGRDAPASGPMQLASSVCAALSPRSRAQCEGAMHDSADLSFELGLRYAASLARRYNGDPVKIAAAFTRGSTRRSDANRWGLDAPDGFLDRFVLAYNAYRSWDRLGRHHAPDPAPLANEPGANVGAYGLNFGGPDNGGFADELGTFDANNVRVYRTGMGFDLDVAPDAHAFDGVVLDAAMHDVTVLPIVIARPGGTVWAPPQTMAEWANLATAFHDLAARFGPGGSFWAENPTLPAHPIRAWEVWNEPNGCGFFDDAARCVVSADPSVAHDTPAALHATAQDFRAVLRVAHDALRSADPHARVIYGGLANTPGSPHGTQFLEDSLAGVADDGCLFDAVAVHPYAHSPQDAVTVVSSVEAALFARGSTGLSPALDAHVWVTEFGYAVALGGGARMNALRSSPVVLPFHASDVAGTEAAQAHALGHTIDLLVASRANATRADRLPVGPLVVFDLYDIPDDGTAGWDHHAGLLRLPDLSPRPAWGALTSRATAMDTVPLALPPVRACSMH